MHQTNILNHKLSTLKTQRRNEDEKSNINNRQSGKSVEKITIAIKGVDNNGCS